MKKVYNYAFKLVCVYILVLSVFSIFNIKLEVNKNSASIINNSKDKMLDSTVIVEAKKDEDNLLEPEREEVKEDKKENKEEKKVEESKPLEYVEEKKEEVKPTPAPTPVPTPTPAPTPAPTPKPQPQNVVDTSSFPVLASESVNISHYGPDCQGCGNGETAAGYNVGGGRITYEDKTYGTLRVVAADKKYPLGTVIRLSKGDFKANAIVLDRGGGIGDGKKYQIDLLVESEAACNNYGVYYGATLEVLRYGY